MVGFDDVLYKREYEFRKKVDDLSNFLFVSEFKVSLIVILFLLLLIIFSL